MAVGSQKVWSGASPFSFSLALPSLSLPLEVGPILRLEGLGEHLSFSAGPDGAQAPNGFWCILSIILTENG